MARGKKKRKGARRTAGSPQLSVLQMQGLTPAERTLRALLGPSSWGLGTNYSGRSIGGSTSAGVSGSYLLPTDGAPLPLGPFSPGGAPTAPAPAPAPGSSQSGSPSPSAPRPPRPPGTLER